MAGPDKQETDQIYRQALKENDSIDLSGLSNPRNFKQAENFLNQIFSINEFNRTDGANENNKGRPSLSLKSYVNQVKNVISALEAKGGVESFVLTNAALHIMNPKIGRGRIVNPITTIIGPPPLVGGYTTDTLDVPTAYSNPTTDNPGDRLQQQYKGQDVSIKVEGSIPPITYERKLTFPDDDGGALGGAAKALQVAGLGEVVDTVNSIVGGQTLEDKYKEYNMNNPKGGAKEDLNMTDKLIFDMYDGFNGKAEDVAQGVSTIKPDYEKIFDKRIGNGAGKLPGWSQGGRGHLYFAPMENALQSPRNYARKERLQRNIDSFFNGADVENGWSKKIEDIGIAVPFVLVDTRKTDRYLYFRAFLTEFREDISPKWTKEDFYGRVDPVGTYMNTERIFSISFKIVAMSLQGLSVMWKKINNFCKMLYPTYVDGNLSAAPTVRLRVGDVCCDGNGNGLPGWIEGLSIDYSESTWEIEEYNEAKGTGKVPQIADISFTFQVIHQEAPSNDEGYNFDTTYFRRMGNLKEVTSKQDQSQNESTDQNGETEEGLDEETERSLRDIGL